VIRISHARAAEREWRRDCLCAPQRMLLKPVLSERGWGIAWRLALAVLLLTALDLLRVAGFAMLVREAVRP